MMTTAKRTLISVLLTTTALLGCDDGPTEPRDELQGGILATFTVSGESFRAWVTNQEAIQQILDLREGRSIANIPNAPLRRGPGPGDHNAPFSWHMDGEDLRMAEVAIEVCDGRPSFVEENVDEFVDNVGRYCPWNAQLAEVVDLR